MATVISRNGKRITLLNPSEKGAKYAKELKKGYKIRNDGSYALGKDKKGIRLSKEGRAYRAGFLDAQKASAKAYKARKKKK